MGYSEKQKKADSRIKLSLLAHLEYSDEKTSFNCTERGMKVKWSRWDLNPGQMEMSSEVQTINRLYG